MKSTRHYSIEQVVASAIASFHSVNFRQYSIASHTRITDT